MNVKPVHFFFHILQDDCTVKSMELFDCIKIDQIHR